jgi:hypothetical protein
MNENWRRENAEYINNAARMGKLLFHLDDYETHDDDESPGAYALHDQVMQTIDVPENKDKESGAGRDKGWQVSDPFRGDHVLDAWYLAMWTIFSQQMVVVPGTAISADPSDPWASQKAALARAMKADEERELNPFKNRTREPMTDVEAFKKMIQPRARGWIGGHYDDES